MEPLLKERNDKSNRIFYLRKGTLLLVRQSMGKNKWDKRQLLWICYNIEIGNELVDPINFIEQDFAYLNHVKNCYYIVNIS